MALNISFQLCGLAFLLLIIVLLSNRNIVNTKTLRSYIYLLAGSTISVIFDISSVITLSMDDYETSIINELFCKLYLVCMFITIYLFFLYVLVRYGIDEKLAKKCRIIVSLPIIPYIIWGYFTDINYYVNGNVAYTYGLYVWGVYAYAFVVLVLVVLKGFAIRNRLDKNTIKPLVFLLIVFLIAVLIQLFNNEYLLISFALSIVMVYMYMCLENPGEFIDRISGLYNTEGAKIIMSEKCGGNIKAFIVSLKDFKFINDTFGVAAANGLIKQIASFLKSLPCDIVYRTAGTSFVMVYYGDENIEKNIEKIKDRLKDSFEVAGVSITVNSVLLLFDPDDSELSAQEMINYINYFIKNSSDEEKDIVYIKKGEIEEKKKNDNIENSIIKALNNNELMVYYQPIYNNTKEIFTSAEALMRIKNDEGKFIPPDIFIPIAEKNGLIVKLGMELFEKVCAFIEKNDLQNTYLEYIDVNLSVIQCMQHDLADKLVAVMNKYHINPSFINFEITETAASNSESTLLMNMKKLIDLNSSFSLDDYGSGYSNINYVLELPICVLKYDKNMVWSSFEGEKGRVIMEYTVNMTKELRLKSLAEGVETKEQFERIKELGIEYTQGYYFSRPLPEDEFIEKIKQDMINKANSKTDKDKTKTDNITTVDNEKDNTNDVL